MKNEQKVTKRFEKKVRESISKNEPLMCVGYYLPDIDFAKLLNDKTFSQPVFFIDATFYQGVNLSGVTFSEAAFFMKATFSGEITNFSGATFSGVAFFSGARFSSDTRFARAKFSERTCFLDSTFFDEVDFNDVRFCDEVDFTKAIFTRKAFFYDAKFAEKAEFCEVTFSEGALFSDAIFSEQVDFSLSKFLNVTTFEKSKFAGETEFREVLFEQPKKVTFDDSDLSKVSFADSDITRIKFGDKITWGGEDGLTIIEEEWLERKAKGKNKSEYRGVSLGLVLSVYRSLRENYEFRLRYDEAGEFFTKEMELKRKYREVKSENGPSHITKNSWLRRNLLSLIGLYHLLSDYGESILRPFIIGVIVLSLSTFFFSMQSNLTLEPAFPFFTSSNSTASTFVGFERAANTSHWLEAFERSFADFLPLLSIGGDVKLGIIDYSIKIVGTVLTFGLLAIALRRKFERKYTR